MNELFLGLLDAPLWMTVPLAVVLYLSFVGILRAFLRPAIVNNLDPLHITLILFTGPGLIGFLLIPALTHAISQSFILIAAFLCAWLLIIRFTGKPTVIDFRDRMGFNFQATLLVLAITIIVAHVVVNMIIPGTIPLFSEGGGSARFEATTNSRLLAWLSFTTAPTTGAIYALTENLRIRKLAVIAVAVQLGASLLFASKAAILGIVFIFLNSLFVASIRNNRRKYKALRRKLVASSILVAVLIPVYLSFIGFGGGGGVGASVAIRLLTGFDQLIYASELDILRNHGFQPLLTTNIVEYQLMSYFKVLFSAQYDYDNVGQYVLESVTGIKVEGPSTFPNSNLILETIFTSGTYLGAFIFVAELGLFYWCRRVALEKPITPYSLVLVQSMVFNPFGLFLSGQDWLTQMILMYGLVIVALALSNLLRLGLQKASLEIVPYPG